VDAEQAIASRKAILEWVAAHHVLVGGMHIPFPSVGVVSKSSDGNGYVFTVKQP
jgi:hypothetical protein